MEFLNFRYVGTLIGAKCTSQFREFSLWTNQWPFDSDRASLDRRGDWSLKVKERKIQRSQATH